MKRGEIWTASGWKDYTGKPRPVAILQDDRFELTDSITVCPLTTDSVDSPLIRLPVVPSVINGLRSSSRLMVDKITTIPKSKFGAKAGRLTDKDMVRLNRALVVFLGLSS
jgi:mRNA interferase MazF